MKKILATLMFTFVSLATMAQEQDQERPDRWYDIEVLVFEQRNPSTAEELPATPARPDSSGAIELVSGTAAGQSTPYQLLPAENLRLRSAFNKLNASGRYQPILHTAWRQSVPPRERADRIHLNSKGVDGVITVGISRYLHVTADLLVPKSGTKEITKFRLQGQLRMRSGEVHYIDHPLGGVLMMVTPYNP